MTYCPDVVIYHHPCRDGFAAAWACWKRFGNSPEYVGTNYGQAIPDVVADQHVLIVDFSYKRAAMIEIAKRAKSVIVLDHHKSAQAELADWIVDDVAGDFWAGDNPLKHVWDMDERTGHPIAAHFDMDHSGAVLAWQFCHDLEPPMLIKLIEDRDLWRFKYEDTKAFNVMLQTVDNNFDTWDCLNQTMHNERIMEAHGMLRYQNFLVHTLARKAHWRTLDGIRFLSVNCPKELSSEVANQILIDNPETPFAATFSQGLDDNGVEYLGWSLRSTDARLDVSTIAERHGGGGHRNAAGFVERLE